MDVDALIKAYNALSAVEQSMFAAIVRAHQVFNSPEWREELARRNQQIDKGAAASMQAVEQLVRQLDVRTA